MRLGRANLRMIGIAVTLACLVLAVYAVDWRQMIGVLIRVDPKPLGLAFALLLGTLIMFALRWQQLIAHERRPMVARAFNFLMIGYLANAILPARPGDIIRAVLLRQISGISFSIGMASIVLERLLDVLAICTLGLIASFVVRLPALVATGLYSLTAAGFGLFLLMTLLSWRRDLIGRTMRRYPGLLRYAFVRFFAEWLERFASAIALFNSPGRLFASIVLTFFGWTALTVILVVLVGAFHLPAPPVAAVLVLVATSLGATVPSSPGSLGVYHFMAVLALSVWHVETSTAVAFAIGAHALAIGAHITLGLLAAWYEGIGIFGLTQLARSDLTVAARGS
jgi:uncharacterized protein (TIRG00374 family)